MFFFIFLIKSCSHHVLLLETFGSFLGMTENVSEEVRTNETVYLTEEASE